MGLKKAFSLTLDQEDIPYDLSIDVQDNQPFVPSSSNNSGRKVKLKIKSSPVEQVVEMTKLEDEDIAIAAAAKCARKWSYHGTTNPVSPVEAPKRHSFSTAPGKSGIVVSNNDLVSLLGPKHCLTPPGKPVPCDAPPIPPLQTNQRPEGGHKVLPFV